MLTFYYLSLYFCEDHFMGLIFEYSCHEDVLYLFGSGIGEGSSVTYPGFKVSLMDGSCPLSEEPQRLLSAICHRDESVLEAELKLALTPGNLRWYSITAKYIPSADSVIGSVSDIDYAREEMDRLKEQTLIDPLSKVYNKAAGIEIIKQFLAERSSDVSCALAVLDIDNFKTVNDSFGHLYGDAVISMVAGSIKNLLVGKDTIGRFGGDEFFVFFDNGDRDVLESKLENIRATVNTMSAEMDISISLGCAIGHGGDIYEELFKQADSALYKAKKNGKNRFEFFDGEYSEESISYAENLADPNRSTKEHSMSEVALEIASKSQNTESAICNIMRHIAILMQLDEINIFYHDIEDSRIDLLFRYYREQDGQYNVVNAEKRKGHYAPEDLLLFRERLSKNHVIAYTPAFKEGFKPRFYNVLAYSDNISMLYVANVSMRDNNYYVSGFKCNDKKREWTTKEKNDLLDVQKIIAMYLNSSYAITTREKAMEEKLAYMPSGAFTLQRFYQETGKVTGNAGEVKGCIAVVHFHLSGYYAFCQAHGRSAGDDFTTGFVKKLLDDTGRLRLVAQYEDLVNTAMLTVYDDLESAKEAVSKEINDYMSTYTDLDPFMSIHAAICPFEIGRTMGDALDAARYANLHADLKGNYVVVAPYVPIPK